MQYPHNWYGRLRSIQQALGNNLSCAPCLGMTQEVSDLLHLESLTVQQVVLLLSLWDIIWSPLMSPLGNVTHLQGVSLATPCGSPHQSAQGPGLPRGEEGLAEGWGE